MSTIEHAKGKNVSIYFDSKKCIHSRGCVLSRPDVFVPNVSGEWIHPDLATTAEIVELAHNCPSGAITYESSDVVFSEKPPKVNLVRVRENGPLAIHAELTIKGEDPVFRATLCRCGQSKNKPYCDSSHGPADFVATGEVTTSDSTPLEKRDGPLTIALAENGPLLATGPLEVLTGTGKTVNRVMNAAFCRCGASATKPYCDGSHVKVGFKSLS